MTTPELALHEEALLLALRDEEGTIASGTQAAHAIAGALLAELLLRERIRIDVPRRNRRIVQLVSDARTGDPLLDECLQRVATARRRASADTWVGRFAGLRGLEHRVAEPLCRRGILREVEGRVLWIFTRTLYPEADPGPEDRLVERLRAAIVGDDADVDPRTAVLVGIAGPANLLRMVVDGRTLKARKARVEAIVNGEVCAAATKAAIDAMQAAAMAAVIAGSVAATTAATASH